VRAWLHDAVKTRGAAALRARSTPPDHACTWFRQASEPVIGLALVEELTIRIPHADTAIVTCRNPILNTRENRSYDFRWVQVHARLGRDWRSQ